MKNRLQHRSWVSRVRLVLAKVALALPVALMTTLVANPSAQAQTFTVLYSFTGGADGSFPNGLLRDAAGNLYGTAQGGGASNLGTVFKLDRSGQYKVLHSFTGADGVSPVAGLIRDAAGNLYGTTYQGGASGLGVVFKLDRTRTETALHSFTGGADGRNPAAALILDAAGNLYGTTTNGGDSDLGTVFKLDVTGKETVLHSFTGGTDGAVPYADLIRDAAGNLYGTTSVGGSSGCFGVGCGTVFKLDTTGRETVLYSFSGGTDGSSPYAGLIRDAAGNLYGTAIEGGDLTCYSYGCGTVFELDAIGEFKVLHSFTGPDGVGPLAGLVGDLARNLYGIAQVGGASNLGTVFKLTLNTTGKYEVLHSFNGADGSYPQRNGPLVRDAAGNLYGTATVGGDFGYGTVFKLTP